jgi:pimeloyl-ACP methyl ester carboxylesterase
MIRHHTVTLAGQKVFYRESGSPHNPTILLLHGFPAGSHMFRNLMPKLAERFHVIAPDYIGFGHSSAPSSHDYRYSFDNLAQSVAALIDHLHLKSYILYMQDYGGPIGFRLFMQRPTQVAGFIIQNANAYMEGVGDMPKQVFLPLWQSRNPETEAAARNFLKLETTQFQYMVGAQDPAAINPDNWLMDQALLDRPGTDLAMLDLLDDYKSNVAAYDQWHAAFRQHKPKTLIVWGKHDPFFIPPGAEAYKRDLPDAKLVWLDGGHFVLDEHADTVASEIIASFQ